MAASAVPVFENTTATCGNLRIIFSIISCMACDWESDVLGMRKAFMTMFFSSSVGMNSWPSRVNSSPAMMNKTTAPAMKVSGLRIARFSAGS